MSNKHLKGLNTLRFFAALLVLLYHGVEHLEDFGIYSLSQITLFHQGTTAVDFFFVLSGFLITYLAIYEIKENKKVNFRLFFIRRVFRIMPLYYLTFILMFCFTGFIYPLITGEDVLTFPLLQGALAYILMLPNIVMPLWKASTLNIFWSIGVEEQFYLLFPLLIIGSYFVKNKVNYFLGVFSIYFIFYFYIKSFNPFYSVLNEFIGTLKFHFMLLGMFFAFLAHKYLIDKKDTKWQVIINNKYVQVFIIAAVIFKLSFISDTTSLHKDSISGLLYVYLIIMVSFSTKGLFVNHMLNNKFKLISYFGAISYGIYLLHPLVSYFIRFLVVKNQTINSIVVSLPFVYLCVLLFCTLVVAHISYNFYEKKFLKLKNKFK